MNTKSIRALLGPRALGPRERPRQDHQSLCRPQDQDPHRTKLQNNKICIICMKKL